MGNITGKGDGDENGGDVATDIGSISPTPLTKDALPLIATPQSLSGMGNVGPTLGMVGGTSSSIAGSKKKQDDSSSQDAPYTVLERIFGDRGIPMVFRWELGGDEVFITGTFNGWSAKIPMARSGNDFVHIHELARGKHAYKFIVDDEWRFTSDQHTMADKSGNINNFLDLTDFKPKFENLPDLCASLASRYLDESLYGNRIPDINEYTKEPPTLPQHLRSIVLNFKSGIPQHVTLDHLYCTARKDGLMVLGMAQRYQAKYVTTIYYSPVNGGFPGVMPGKRSSSSATGSSSTAATSASTSASATPPSANKTAATSSSSSKRPYQ